MLRATLPEALEEGAPTVVSVRFESLPNGLSLRLGHDRALPLIHRYEH
jgi:hypothetical protein